MSEASNVPAQPTMETADSIIAVCMNADANNGLVTSKARVVHMSRRCVLAPPALLNHCHAAVGPGILTLCMIIP